MTNPKIPDPPGYTTAAIPDPPGYAPAAPLPATATGGGGGYGGSEPPPGTIPQEPSLSWGDVLGSAAKNAIPSAYEAAKGIVHAVADPVTTVKSVGSLIHGGLSKLGGASDEEVEEAKQRLHFLSALDPNKPVTIPGLGTVIPKNDIPNLKHVAQQNSTDRVAARKEIEQTFDTMKDFYIDRYGSLEGFKKAVAEDPAGVLLDASTAFTGVGGALRGTGMVATKVGAQSVGKAVTRAGEISGKIGAGIDPINQAINLGTWGVTKAIPTAAKETVGLTTGAGPDAFAEAFRVAKERAMDPSNVDAATAYKRLTDAMDGARTPEQTVALANQGVQTMKADASRAFEFRKNNPTDGWYHDATVLDTTPVRDAWNNVYKTMFGKNGEPVVKLDQLKEIEKIGDVIAKWEMGNPAGHTLGGFDDLKRTIQGMRGTMDDKDLNRVVKILTDQARDIAAKQSDKVYAGKPNNLYRESQAGYKKTMDELEEIEKSLGVGSKQSSIDGAARKITSVMRNNVNTNFGQRLKNVETLETTGHIDIMPEIAGHALNTWAPRGITGKIIGAALTTLPGLGVSLPAASPKLMGKAATKLGTLAGWLDKPAQDVGTVIKAGQKAGAPVAGQLSHIGQGEYDYGTPPLARGGALRRLSGGR
jgi:hypothetical protein